MKDVKQLRRYQFLIDASMCQKDKWSDEQIQRREALREAIEILKGMDNAKTAN